MIDDLFENNVRWSIAKTKTEPTYFQRLAAQQAPEYLWVGCSDSRVPANEIVGLDPGELFVHRNVANIMHTGDLNLLTVLEYSVQVLKISHIIVCGHYGCGGIIRALQGGTGALVDHWLAPVVDLYHRNRARFDAIKDDEVRANLLCEMNVEMQVTRIAATPIVQQAWCDGRGLAVHGWIYGLKDGLLRDLGLSISGPSQLNEAAITAARPRTGDPDALLGEAWLRVVEARKHKSKHGCCDSDAEQQDLAQSQPPATSTTKR